MKRLIVCILFAALSTTISLRSTDLWAQAGMRRAKPATKERPKTADAKADEADEKSDDAKSAEAPKAEPAAKAAGKAAEEAPAAEPTPPETDPLVIAVLDSNPQSPVELVQAASVLVSRKRAVLAKPLVDKLLAANLPPEELRALARRFGPGTIVQLGLAPELAPAGRQFADAVDAAVHAAAVDPARIGRLVDQLGAPTLDERRAAAYQLRVLGPAAVAPLIKILADPAQAAQHAQARAGLVAMGDQVVPPLLGVLDSGNAPLEAQVIEVLGQLSPGEAGPAILGAAADEAAPADVHAAALRALANWKGGPVTPTEARETLEHEVRKWFAEGRLPAADVSGFVTVWQWDPAQGASVPAPVTPRQAADLTAARLSADLAQADPSDENRRQALVAGLQAFGPQPTLTTTVPAEDLDAALALALESQRFSAAAALASALGKSGWAGAVSGRSGEPAPLVLATRTADRRLQHAAVSAVLALDPQDPFTGAGAVAETLRHLATGQGVRRAVVAHPLLGDARDLGAWLATRGYEPIVVATGAEAYQAAIASADVELVLLHEALADPCAYDTLKNLRRDRRTATLPVGLMWLPKRDRSPLDPYERDPYTVANVVPVTEPIFERYLERLLAKAGAGVTAAPTRREQGDLAVQALGNLVENPRPWFDLRTAELALLARMDQAVGSEGTIRALGALGTPAAQRRLVELIGNSLAPMPERELALTALKDSIRRHGILLTTDQLLAQYDRYHASQGEAAEEQRLLSSLLDALEAPRAAAAAANGN
jgi:hypothetical protein